MRSCVVVILCFLAVIAAQPVSYCDPLDCSSMDATCTCYDMIQGFTTCCGSNKKNVFGPPTSGPRVVFKLTVAPEAMGSGEDTVTQLGNELIRQVLFDEFEIGWNVVRVMDLNGPFDTGSVASTGSNPSGSNSGNPSGSPSSDVEEEGAAPVLLNFFNYLGIAAKGPLMKKTSQRGVLPRGVDPVGVNANGEIEFEITIYAWRSGFDNNLVAYRLRDAIQLVNCSLSRVTVAYMSGGGGQNVVGFTAYIVEGSIDAPAQGAEAFLTCNISGITGPENEDIGFSSLPTTFHQTLDASGMVIFYLKIPNAVGTDFGLTIRKDFTSQNDQGAAKQDTLFAYNNGVRFYVMQIGPPP